MYFGNTYIEKGTGELVELHVSSDSEISFISNNEFFRLPIDEFHKKYDEVKVFDFGIDKFYRINDSYYSIIDNNKLVRLPSDNRGSIQFIKDGKLTFYMDGYGIISKIEPKEFKPLALIFKSKINNLNIKVG